MCPIFCTGSRVFLAESGVFGPDSANSGSRSIFADPSLGNRFWVGRQPPERLQRGLDRLGQPTAYGGMNLFGRFHQNDTPGQR